jgi:hypothetical protein
LAEYRKCSFTKAGVETHDRRTCFDFQASDKAKKVAPLLQELKYLVSVLPYLYCKYLILTYTFHCSSEITIEIVVLFYVVLRFLWRKRVRFILEYPRLTAPSSLLNVLFLPGVNVIVAIFGGKIDAVL